MEKDRKYYDSIYAQGYDTKRYQDLYDTVVDMVGGEPVIEIGCGTGDLAKMLLDDKVKYRGFDFSAEGIKQAKEKVGLGIVQVGDAYDKKMYKFKGDTLNPTFVALEVLEHVRDFEVLKNIPIGSRVIFSVPNYPDPAHLRVYHGEKQIKKRFAGYLNVNEVKVIEVSGKAKMYVVDAVRKTSKIKYINDTISACIISGNEEEVIQDCIMSIEQWVDEIIFIDTGITDKTLEIAKKYGGDKLKVYKHKWDEDFSAARNFSMSKATKEWIFIIDCDERVDFGNGENLKRMLPTIEQDVIIVDVLNLYLDAGTKKRVPRSRLPSFRFFRTDSNPSYVGRVHNRPVVQGNSQVYRTPFIINHLGYDLSDEKKAEKFERTVKMCKRATEDDPESPEVWYNYAKSLKVKDNKFNEDAKDIIMEALDKGIAIGNGKNDVHNMHMQLLCQKGWIHHVNKEHKEGVEYGKKALLYKPDYLDAIYLIANCYTYGISIVDGEIWLKKYLEEQGRYDFKTKVDSIAMEHCNSRAQAYRSLAEIEGAKEQMSMNRT